MCKFIDILKSGIQDLNAHRKNNVIAFVLVFLSIVVYLGINAHYKSMNSEMQKTIDFFEGRILIASSMEENLEEDISYLEEMYGNDERVREIKPFVAMRTVKWLDTSEVLYTDSADMSLFGIYEAVFDYDYKGEKREPSENEIILPRYLCNIGIYDDKNIGNADELIGKTIKIEYTSLHRRYCKEYEFTVIGTYNNLEARTSDCMGIVNTQVMLNIKKMEDKEIEEIEEGYGEDYEKVGMFSVYVKEGYDVEEFKEEVFEKTGGRIIFIRNMYLSPSVEGYYKYIIVIGSIVSLMLLFIGIINIIVSSINEVKSRKWEFALKMSMGYTKRDIILTFFVEKFVNLVKALLLAIFTVGLYCIIITYISRNFLEYWKRDYLYIIYPDNMLIALFLVFIAGLIGVLVARLGINEINIAKELKSEE